MEDANPQSPPLAPDPAPASQSQHQPKVQPFQEPFVAPPPQSQSQQQSWQQASTDSQPQHVANARLATEQPQPIRDAVDRAFGQSQSPNTLDPNFIAQVTEAVVKNLQTTSLNPLTPAATQASQYPPPPSVQSVPQSPVDSSSASLPSRYTPPSPQRERDRAASGRQTSTSPEPLLSENDITFGKGSVQYGGMGERHDDTPKPAFGETPVGDRLNDSIREEQAAEDLTHAEEGRAPHTAGSRRGSRDSAGSSSDAPRARGPPPRVPSHLTETTTLERIWQPLFDNGSPTLRLSQFLRGIALHIIEDYEPKGSLVVTPPKMLRFFEQTKVEDEIYPWYLIFGGSMVSASISVMFRRLKCQHHLIQTHVHEVPNVPGLTPFGFETFITCLIQAHPDQGFERLSKAVMNMPISNADYPTERFPKELSRRLLPPYPNPIVEQCIVASMAHESNMLQLRNINAMPPPPTPAPPPPNSQEQSFQERERKPYSQTSFSNEVQDDDLENFVPSVPIERERKPYSAREGTGKVYGSESARDEPSSIPQARFNDASPFPAPRPPHRDYNAGPQGSGAASSDPRAIPSTRRHRSSVGPGMQPPGQVPGGSHPKNRRSPPPTGAYVRSDPANLGDIPAAQYTTNLHNPRPQAYYDDGMHPYPNRRATASASNANAFDDEQMRGKPIPTRNSQPPPPQGPNGYDSSYGSANVGSYPGPRARHYDDRRRSMYGGPPSMNTGGAYSSGGSDGWGSFANGGPAPGIYPPPQGYGNTGMQH